MGRGSSTHLQRKSLIHHTKSLPGLPPRASDVKRAVRLSWARHSAQSSRHSGRTPKTPRTPRTPPRAEDVRAALEALCSGRPTTASSRGMKPSPKQPDTVVGVIRRASLRNSHLETESLMQKKKQSLPGPPPRASHVRAAVQHYLRERDQSYGSNSAQSESWVVDVEAPQRKKRVTLEAPPETTLDLQLSDERGEPPRKRTSKMTYRERRRERRYIQALEQMSLDQRLSLTSNAEEEQEATPRLPRVSSIARAVLVLE